MPRDSSNRPSQWAQRLGYGGLLPFVALAAAVWLVAPGLQALAAKALFAYGASILSFLGAIHWGLTMRDAQSPNARRLAWGVVPSLVAWLAVLLPQAVGLYVLAGSLWVCYAVDKKIYAQFNLHAWLPMRLLLTLVASLCCIAGGFGVVP